MNYQYVDFYAYLRSVLQGENDIHYSLSRGLGGDFYSFFAYYLISPLNLIPVLFPDRLVPLGISIELLICFGLAGISCYLALKHFVPEIHQLTLIYFSAAYSLSGWFLLNAENFQFLPAAILLPLVAAELDRVGKDGKMIRLILFLTLSVILNFYIGYMVCLFVVLWILFSKRISQTEKLWAAFVLSGLICLPFMIPIIRQLLLSANHPDPSWYVPKWNFSIVQFLKKMIPGQFDASQYRDNGLPPVYCGMIAPVLSLLYFLRGAFDRKKQHRLILLLVLFFSMIFRPLTMIWHGFSVPHWWPYRFAFLYIFLLLLTAAESRTRLPFWLLIIGFCGLVFNMDRTLSVKIADAVPVDRYAEDTAGKRAVISEITEKDTQLYRIEDLHPRSDNDPMHFAYLGITNFDSLANRKTVDFLGKLGFLLDRNTIAYGQGNTLFANSLLGVRYILDQNRIITNDYAVGPAFLSNEKLDGELPDRDDPAAFQNELANQLGISSPILSECRPVAEEFENLECDQEFCWKTSASDPAYIRYTFTSDEKKMLYACTDQENYLGELFFVRSGDKLRYDDPEYFLPLGMIEPGQEMSVTVEVNDPILDVPDITFISEDISSVQKFADQAFQNVACTKVSSSEIEITFPETQDTRSLTVTIPYDSGWHALSDSGEDLEISPVWDTFMAVNIPEKTARIRLIYRPSFFLR